MLKINTESEVAACPDLGEIVGIRCHTLEDPGVRGPPKFVFVYCGHTFGVLGPKKLRAHNIDYQLSRVFKTSTEITGGAKHDGVSSTIKLTIDLHFR